MENQIQKSKWKEEQFNQKKNGRWKLDEERFQKSKDSRYTKQRTADNKAKVIVEDGENKLIK